MNGFDYAVLFAVILGIALYGILRTRGRRTLHDYLRGKKHSWLAIGLSVMATQASAVTFLSTPGQGYADGMAFVQNYFALPLAMVIIAAVFLPMYRRLNVYTAYEYLGKRFDKKTRLLAAAIFLIQRGMGAGITILAPAIVLSTVFGWSLTWTIICSGVVCTTYTVAGGSDAVTHTQKYQFAIIMGGMVTAFCILLSKIPCSFGDALVLAGHFGKTHAVSFNPNLKERYTFWTGMLGGIFLMLSYFGTDQSQVQRYISGDDLRESRLGLMFNALFKVPMQFGVLLLGVMLFVFYLFNPSPIFFNRTIWEKHSHDRVVPETILNPPSTPVARNGDQASVEDYFHKMEDNKREELRDWMDARRTGDAQKERDALNGATEASALSSMARKDAQLNLKTVDTRIATNDSDYVFIDFILDNLPHGLIGLLVACFFAATLNSKAAELNALASCTVIDFYRYLIRPPSSPAVENGGRKGLSERPVDSTDSAPSENRKSKIENQQERHYVRASRAFTVAWGVIAILFALFANFADNLIQAANIIGSVFYGVVLGLFLIAFFIKFIRGTAAFWGAVLGEVLVLGWFVAGHYVESLNIAYLWYNLIGSLGCIFFAVVIQMMIGPPREERGFPVTTQGT